MSKYLTEQKVLRKLGIPDFRHLTKDKVIKMAAMLDKMDPEVAKKALEQFPEFTSTAKEILIHYKDTLDKSLVQNHDSVQKYYDTCNSIIESLKKQLDTANQSFEERKYIIDQMLYIANMMKEKDSENKKFLFAMAMGALTTAGAVVLALGTVLGASTTAHDNNLLDSSQDDNSNS